MKYFEIKQLIILVFLCGCAGTSSHRTAGDENLLPEIDVLQVKDKTDEALKLAQEVNLDVEVLSTKLADLDNRIVSLSDEVSSISAAKIEELETRVVLLTEAIKELKTATVPVVQIAPAAPSIAENEKKAPPQSPEKGKKKALRDTTHRPPAAGQSIGSTFAPSTAANLLSSPEYEAYQAGLRLFQSHSYDRAIKAFDDELAQFPSGKYVDNANYWRGECYYYLSNYSSAIGAFGKVVSVHGTEKADDAYYKIALSYLKMGQTSAAKEAFSNLIEYYPASEYVPRARQYLQKLR
jgi:tol-pal system protein YbgF